MISEVINANMISTNEKNDIFMEEMEDMNDMNEEKKNDNVIKMFNAMSNNEENENGADVKETITEETEKKEVHADEEMTETNATLAASNSEEETTLELNDTEGSDNADDSNAEETTSDAKDTEEVVEVKETEDVKGNNDGENVGVVENELPDIKDLTVIPMAINNSSRSFTVEEVYNNIANKKFLFDNAVQRSNVWTVEQQSLLMDSFLHKMPVPPLYSREVEGGNYDFLDGKQRCEAIRAFMDDEFALTDIPVIESAHSGETLDINGYKYSELPKSIQDAIRNTSLLIYLYKNDDGTFLNDDQTADIFFRMNNGTALKKIEKMRVKVKSYDKVQKLAAHPIFNDMLNEKAKNGYIHEDLAIKALKLSKYGDGSLSLLSKDIAPYVEQAEFTDEAVEHVSKVFTMLKDIHDYLNEKAESEEDKDNKKTRTAVAKRLYVRMHLISLIKLTERLLEEKKSKEDFADFLIKFYNNGERGKTSCSHDYNDACHSGSNSAANVSKRLEALTKEYEKAC